MEEFENNNYNGDLVYCLEKINMLISKVNKYNSDLRQVYKNAEILKISVLEQDNLISEEIENLKNMYSNLIDNSYNNDYEIGRVKNELDSRIYNLESMIDTQISLIAKEQNEEIFKKAIQCIYIARWRNKQKEIDYLDYKDTFFSKISGEAKYRKLSIEKKMLESELIKKEYNKKVRSYNGENIREIAIMLNNATYSSFELFDFKEKILSVFMIDDLPNRHSNGSEWRMANIVPYGFFEKMKYYKMLNNNTEQEIIHLKEALDIQETETVPDVKKNKIGTLQEINMQIKNLIENMNIAM